MRISDSIGFAGRPAGTDTGIGTTLVPTERPSPPVAVEEVRPASTGRAVENTRSFLEDVASRVDVRRFSPRAMAELSLDLYSVGLLTYDEYALLAAQPELHPDFDRTIGSLGEESADPDRPRDHVRIWEERVGFERRHGGDDAPETRRAERILTVLRRLEASTDLTV